MRANGLETFGMDRTPFALAVVRRTLAADPDVGFGADIHLSKVAEGRLLERIWFPVAAMES